MLNETVRNILTPEFARDNGNLRRRYQEMILALLRLAAVMVVFLPAYLTLQDDPGQIEVILLCLNIAVPLAGALFIRLTGLFRTALYLINLSGFTLITAWAWISGGIESAGIPWLFALMALISTYGDIRASFFALIMAGIACLVLLYGTVTQIVPTSVVADDKHHLIWLLSTILALFFLFASIAWTMRRGQRAKHKLRQLSIEAQQANRAKTAFLSSMSHELRTPLNAVIGFSQLLQGDKENDLSESQLRAVGHIYSSGSHLLTLVNQILELSHLEEGETPVRLEKIAVAELYDEALVFVQQMAEEKSIIFSHLEEEEYGQVIGDRRQLLQSLLNLMSNAILYNRDGGQVTVSWQASGSDRIRIDVTDTGQGIAKKFHAQIFEPFDRLDNVSGTITGTGVGLYMTKRMVENMGGSIDFKSIPDQGSTFSITLPKAPD